jgi:RNA polymerase sigma-70 factor (ECF subfamily)
MALLRDKRPEAHAPPGFLDQGLSDIQDVSRFMNVPSSTRKLTDRTKTEEAMVLRLRRGDEEAFRELVTQHHDALIRIARTYVADWDVAKDVVQDTWMVVTHSLHRFEGRSSLRAWICGILAHKARDRRSREKCHRTLSWAGHPAFPSRSWDDQTPEKILASRQAVDAMQRAIDQLPINLKSVLMLRDRDGVEARHVCAMLNINRTNLYVRLHRARERVKVAVETALG